MFSSSNILSNAKLNLTDFVALLICVSIGIYFLAPSGKINHYPIYILTILVCLDKRSWPKFVDLNRNSKLFFFTTLLITYSGLSAIWTIDATTVGIVKNLGKALFVIVFIFSIITSIQSRSWFCRAVLVCLLIASAGSIVFNFVSIYLSAETIPARMGGFGRLRHPVIAGLVYGSLIICCASMVGLVRSYLSRMIILILIILLLVAVLLSGSRGIWFGLLAGMLSIVVLRRKRGFMVFSFFLIPGTLALFATLALLNYSFINLRSDFSIGEMSLTELQVPNHEASTVFDSRLPLSKEQEESSQLKMVYSGDNNTNLSYLDGAKLSINLYSDTDENIGMGWPAFKVDPSQLYVVSVKAKSQKPTRGGFYFRMQEYDGSLPQGFSHISHNSHFSEYGVLEAARQVIGLAENVGLTSEWREFVFTYQPSVSAKWASPIALNWTEMGLNELHISELVIIKNKSWLREIRHSIDQKYPNFDRGMSFRDLIWEKSLERVLDGNWLLGMGYLDSGELTLENGIEVLHPHSLYVASLFYGGIIGLALLLLTISYALMTLWRSKHSVTKAIALPMLSYALVVLIVDGDKIIEKINHIWIIFWLPIALAISLNLREESCRANVKV